MKKACVLILALAAYAASWAQGTLGMSGLLTVPSATMLSEGDAEVSSWFLSKHLTPDKPWNYNTCNLAFSITPFWWMEMGYAMTFMRNSEHGKKLADKDRSLSLKFNPLREGKWWPAVAIGGNDVLGSNFKFRGENDGNSYYSNAYIALSKHFMLWNQELGAHLSYRYCFTKACKSWQGVVGGITFRPSFYRDLRFVAEYTSREVNIGIDCLIWKHFFVQVALARCKYFSGGLAYRVNLF